MTQIVKDGRIDDLPDGNVFDVLLAVEAKVDRDNLCSDGCRNIHPRLLNLVVFDCRDSR